MLSAAERFRAELNAYLSKGDTGVLDELYPYHDGEQDADVASDLYALRDTMHAIMTGNTLLQSRFWSLKWKHTAYFLQSMTAYLPSTTQRAAYSAVIGRLTRE